MRLSVAVFWAVRRVWLPGFRCETRYGYPEKKNEDSSRLSENFSEDTGLFLLTKSLKAIQTLLAMHCRLSVDFTDFWGNWTILFYCSLLIGMYISEKHSLAQLHLTC